MDDLSRSNEKTSVLQRSVSYLTLLASLMFLFSLVVCIPGLCFSQQLDGKDIMQLVDARQQGDTIAATIEMILIGNDGNRRVRRMKTFTKHGDNLTRKIILFLAPADVKGTALLTFDYRTADQEDDQWIYLPALHKTKRISAGNRSGSFMGSDFSYGDLTGKAIDAYSYTVLKEQQIDGHQVWIIEAIPKDNETITLYGYSKSLLIVRQDNFVVIRAVHWLKNKNTLKYNEVIKLEEIDGIWVPLEVRAKTVSNNKTIHQTIIITKDIKLNQPLNEELFTKRRIEQGL